MSKPCLCDTLGAMTLGTTLRVGFFLPGAATLGSVLWLLVAIAPAFDVSPAHLANQAGLRSSVTSTQGLSVVLATAVAAYVLGVVVVMATFTFPTRRIIARIRRKRLEEIKRLNSSAPTTTEDNLARTLTPLFASPVARSGAEVGPPLQRRLELARLEFALSVARSRISPGAQSEIEYRRSTRQICAGMIPAVIISASAATVAQYSLAHQH